MSFTRSHPGKLLALALALASVAVACDGSAPAVDAAAPPAARTAALSLRIDVPAGRPASLSALAFRAAFSGVAAADVLGLVDPLAVAAPARDCQLRDVDRAAAEMVARGDAIELEELDGAQILLADSVPPLRLSPRLYPDLAATIGGVVGEAGPLGLGAVPAQIRVQIGSGGTGTAIGLAPDPAAVTVPATAWVKSVNGAAALDGSLVDVTTDLALGVSGAATAASDVETAVELRPFGATVALSCAIPADAISSSASSSASAAGTVGPTVFVVPRQALSTLVTASGATPGAPVAVGLDLVRRQRQQWPASTSRDAVRISVEVRTSIFVELRP